jgi:hypothetical protein
MDSKGARELARLLEERHGGEQPAVRPVPLKNGDAAPMFHYLGIEPPETSEDGKRTHEPRRRRRRRRAAS